MTTDTPLPQAAQQAAPQAVAKPARSSFVTAAAWVFICLAGAFGLIALIELLAMLVVPLDEIEKLVTSSPSGANMPFYTRFIIAHLGLYIALSFIGMLVLFVTAIGLLKRKRWARPTMIVLLALAAIRYVIAIALQLIYYSPASLPLPPHSSAAAAGTYHTMMTVVMYGSAAFSLAVAAVFVWIMVRLMSPAIKAEFAVVAADNPPAGV